MIVLHAASNAVAQAPPASPAAAEPESTEYQDRVDVGADGRLDIRFRELDLAVALELLSEQTQRNIIITNGVKGTVSTILRRVTFDEALRMILVSNGLTYEDRDGVIIVRNEPPPAPQTDRAGDVMRVFRLKYVTAADAELFIKPLLPEGCIATRTAPPQVGVKPDKENAGGVSPAGEELLIVLGPPAVVERVAAALAEFDVPPRQVLIEATILRATLNEQNALGIDFNTLAGIDLRSLDASSPGITRVTVGNLPDREFDNVSSTVRTDFNQLLPNGGLTFGIIANQVAAFIRALEQTTDVVVMANPKVLALNKQRGEIIVGRRDGYLTTTVTETAAVQTVEFLETGTKLLFRPFIMGEDRIRVEIHPEDSNGGLTPANLPFQETTEATSNVVIRNGHTIVIGGLFRERTQAGSSRVPYLGSIPIFKHLFGVEQDQTTREEVIILLTVHILRESASEAAAFDELRQDVERVRVGMRRGLLGNGRERLADAHYHWAVEHLRRGDANSALFDARVAADLSPTMLDAQKLIERLTGERASTSEMLRMRAFVDELLRADAGLSPRPTLGRPDVERLLRDLPAAESDAAETDEP
ncbi:MAG: hypothetical protein CHACPFDD_04172 [Phycisphaerae bacterium]|nr:hypothetical protein [Phycisphaerae bacterium]